ncbi:cupin domain protein [Acanthamoeba castellanii str. Neff]|uniref:Cupin domain protein n=1 Tax=Acanthamoeba castellanii (strain ATCC 30010 / Neff) TaxID=1257118 RepID=L8HDY2_ACACF|nr:cupin domain protein [Acanthamoeba castellanii str. Neff]ELR22973.1 cupin domain protein [Acanthamoeba castellanii str. Neff]
MDTTRSAPLLLAHTVLGKGQSGAPCHVHSFLINDDGKGFPNSKKLPLLVYEQSVDLKGAADPAAVFERLVVKHQWGDVWRDGVYPYHHYHSTAHEGLGVYAGTATVQFGGDDGISHKCLEQSEDFAVVGFYPRGQKVDMQYGKRGERPASDERIRALPLPDEDPLFGASGPLLMCWHPSS